MSKQRDEEVLKKLSEAEVQALRKKHQESLKKLRTTSGLSARVQETASKNKAVGLCLTIGVVGVYLYTMFAIKQEDFLDKEFKQDLNKRLEN